MSYLPEINIIVPTYNRPSDIKKIVKEIQKQSYPNFKVFIIDDHGEETIEHLIPKNNIFEFKRLEKNIGQASARNVAIEMGKGEIIISLDDDAWFLDNPDALKQTAALFNKFSKMGCLMYNVIEPQKEHLADINKLEDGDEIGFHITCGCAYRRKAIEEIGGFNDFFHSGSEETDITFKLIKRDYSIVFSKSIEVFHNFRPRERSKSWYRQFRKNTTRNDLLIVIMYYPAIYVLPYFFGKWISHIKFSFFNKRNRWDTTFFTLYAGFEALYSFNKAISRRKAISRKQFNSWLKIR